MAKERLRRYTQTPLATSTAGSHQEIVSASQNTIIQVDWNIADPELADGLQESAAKSSAGRSIHSSAEITTR